MNDGWVEPVKVEFLITDEDGETWATGDVAMAGEYASQMKPGYTLYTRRVERWSRRAAISDGDRVTA